MSFNKNHLNWIRWTQNLLENLLFKEYMCKNGCKAMQILKHCEYDVSQKQYPN